VSKHLLTQGSDYGAAEGSKEIFEEAQKDIEESTEEKQGELFEC
jgi:hypothetical protein